MFLIILPLKLFRFDTDNIPGSEFFEGSKYNDGTRNVTMRVEPKLLGKQRYLSV